MLSWRPSWSDAKRPVVPLRWRSRTRAVSRPTSLAATRARASGSSCPGANREDQEIVPDAATWKARTSGSQGHLGAARTKSARKRCPHLPRADDEKPRKKRLHGQIRCWSMYERTSRGTRGSISSGRPARIASRVAVLDTSGESSCRASRRLEPTAPEHEQRRKLDHPLEAVPPATFQNRMSPPTTSRSLPIGVQRMSARPCAGCRLWPPDLLRRGG